jgi:hypothetical protein
MGLTLRDLGGRVAPVPSTFVLRGYWANIVGTVIRRPNVGTWAAGE